MSSRRTPRGGRRSGGRPAALAAVLALACALAIGCGEEGGGGDRAVPDTGIPPGASERALTVTVHFSGPEGEQPVPVRREVALPSGAASPPGPVDSLRAALRVLLRGPIEDEEARGLTSFFSEATAGALRTVELDDGRAVVEFDDLSEAATGASSSAGSRALLDELGATVFEIGSVRSVEYRMEESCERFWNWLQRPCRVVPRPEASGPSGDGIGGRTAS